MANKVKNFYSTLVRFPEFQNIAMLPKEIKNNLAKKIENWRIQNSDRLSQEEQILVQKNIAYLVSTPKFLTAINPENLKRGHKKYHLDHVYPILEGWKNKIDPEEISDYRNLKMLKHDENRNKSSKTNIKIEEFYKTIKKLCH